ncbi:transposase [Streptomyces sp. NPDC002306]
MGCAEAAVAEGREARPAADTDLTAADRRHTFRVRTGIPWQDMPAEYGPWGRTYDLFRRWQRNGTWQRIFTELEARADTKDLIGLPATTHTTHPEGRPPASG